MKPADHFPRLLDDPGLEASELGQALHGLSARLPGAERLASIAAAVGAAPPSVASASVPVLKLVMGAGALVAAAGAVVLWLSTTPPATETQGMVRPPSAAVPSPAVATPQSAPPESATPTRDRPSAAPAPGVPEARSTEAIPAPSAGAPTAVAERNAPSNPHATTTTTTPAPSPASPPARPRSNESTVARPQPGSPIPPPAAPAREAEILRDARLTLEQSPQIALSLTEQHRSEYPGGKFSQEREIIAITALVRLGRSGDAEARAARFRNAYPTSPYNARLDRLVPP